MIGLKAIPLWRPLGPLAYSSSFATRIGDLVRAPLGNKSVPACVVSVTEPLRDGLKDIEEIIAPRVFPTSLIELCLNISDQHLCFPGETLGLALPRDIMRPPRRTPACTPQKQRSLRNLKMRTDEEKAAVLINKSKRPVILHSGGDYTGLTVGMVRKSLNRGKQILMLFPHEPGLARAYERLKPYLAVEVYHAGMGQKERRRIRHGVRSEDVNLVAGLRSAVFLPFTNLELILVFDADSNSYRVRSHHIHYNARDLALFRAKEKGVKVVFLSIMPCVENLHSAGSGKFNLIERRIRQRGKALIADMRMEKREAVLSKPLTDELRKLRQNRALLLLNRLGISARLLCTDCGNVLTCPECGIPLKLTSPGKPLECRLCGRKEEPPQQCPRCKGVRWQILSPGLEGLKKELLSIFPKNNLCEITAGHRPIVEEVSAARVIYGTSAALEYLPPKTTLVAMLSWDAERSRADFRSAERAFRDVLYLRRILASSPESRLIVQTYRPKDKLLEYALKADAEWFLRSELRRRRELGYPPYRRLVLFKKGAKAWDQSRFCKEIRHEGVELLGPYEVNHGVTAVLAKLRRDIDPGDLLDAATVKKSGWNVEVDPAEIF